MALTDFGVVTRPEMQLRAAEGSLPLFAQFAIAKSCLTIRVDVAKSHLFPTGTARDNRTY